MIGKSVKIHLRSDLKKETDSSHPLSSGRSFQSGGALTENAPSPLVFSLDFGKARRSPPRGHEVARSTILISSSEPDLHLL